MIDLSSPRDDHPWRSPQPAPPRDVGSGKGYTLLRTDRNGWIELITDGAQLWVGVQRKLE